VHIARRRKHRATGARDGLPRLRDSRTEGILRRWWCRSS
jgi:hypothetical protein